MLNHKKDMKLLIGKVMEVLAQVTQDKVPETGVFQKVYVTFSYPGAPFCGRLIVEKSYEQENSRRITAGMAQDGDDRLVSNYLYTGTKQEILAWLGGEGNLPGLIDTFEHLKEKAS